MIIWLECHSYSLISARRVTIEPAGTFITSFVLLNGLSLKSLSQMPMGFGSDQIMDADSSVPEAEYKRRMSAFLSLLGFMAVTMTASLFNFNLDSMLASFLGFVVSMPMIIHNPRIKILSRIDRVTPIAQFSLLGKIS